MVDVIGTKCDECDECDEINISGAVCPYAVVGRVTVALLQKG